MERFGLSPYSTVDSLKYNQSHLDDNGSFWTFILEWIQRSFRGLAFILILLDEIQRAMRGNPKSHSKSTCGTASLDRARLRISIRAYNGEISCKTCSSATLKRLIQPNILYIVQCRTGRAGRSQFVDWLEASALAGRDDG